MTNEKTKVTFNGQKWVVSHSDQVYKYLGIEVLE